MDYFKKVDILEKISKLINLYMRITGIVRYIIRRTLPDEDGKLLIFYILDQDKLFMHSKEFKKAHSKLIDKTGKTTIEFYKCMDKWMLLNHPIYIKAYKLSFELLNRNVLLREEDLIELNELYRKVKEMKIGKN